MFYSQWLLSKKGPLGTIWVAAHCHKRIKKDQVEHTKIPSSVEKILQDEVLVVTYRILAYLLLGVVRVFSKKVDYLFHDCRDVLSKINNFIGSKKAKSHMEAMCAPYYSITLPDSFELDAFNLEVLEDESDENVRPPEEIMLEDAWKNEGVGFDPFDKHICKEHAARFEDYSTAYTPVKDVLSPHIMNDDMVVGSSDYSSNLEASMENIRGNEFSLEKCLDPMTLGDAEKHVARPSDEEHHIVEEQMKHPDTEVNFGVEEEPPDAIKSINDEETHLDADRMKFPAVTSPESRRSQRTENQPLSIAIDATPESKFPDAGATTPEFMAVRTPATKEPPRVSNKRKCLCDEIIVLPNKVLKQCIDNASDLVCKRRKAPHTAIHAWKERKISSLPQSFLEPLIPCSSFDLRSLICKKIFQTPEPIEIVEISTDVDVRDRPPRQGSSELMEIPANVGELETSMRQISPEQTPIAPGTPVTHSTSLRLHEVLGTTGSYRAGHASISESMEESSLSEERELDNGLNLMNEEMNSCDEDSQEMQKWSVRTRIVARYLHKSFLYQKKRKEDAVVNLLQVLKGKTKKEGARLFFEILVLKTGGYVEIKQDNAYDGILVLGTPKLS